MNSYEKTRIRDQWNATPCGTGDYLTGIEYASLEFFDRIRENRYEISDPWMKQTIDFSIAKDKKLLEIGQGIGTDLLTFQEAGAEVYGIDITEEHYRLVKLNFLLHDKPGVFKLCDAAEIDFPSNFFDVVYSHGVLHHTPDTVRCISEAYRVLKPGGTFILSLYYTYSAYHLFTLLLYQGILKGQLKNLGYRKLLSTVEYGADGIRKAPLVKTYSKTKLRNILEDFRNVRINIAHFNREHIPFLGYFIPRFLEKRLERFWGWYIIAFAIK